MPPPSADPSRSPVAAQGPYTKDQLAAMLADVESDLVERKETFEGEAPNTVRQAICAFANDLPNHRRAGVIFVGARDDGTPTGLEVNDALLLKLAHCKRPNAGALRHLLAQPHLLQWNNRPVRPLAWRLFH